MMKIIVFLAVIVAVFADLNTYNLGYADTYGYGGGYDYLLHGDDQGIASRFGKGLVDPYSGGYQHGAYPYAHGAYPNNVHPGYGYGAYHN